MHKTILISIILTLPLITAGAQTSNQDAAREYYKKGNIYYQQGKFKEAQEEYNKAIEALKNRDIKTETPSSIAPVASVAAPVPAPSSAIIAPAAEYIIGDDDVLYISVWQNDDLNMEVVVRPDGKISFPLIGDVAARGMTITQLDEEITKRLKEYIRFPEVSISLRKIGGSKVVILGEVQHPGVYSVTGQKTILEAIGLSGGFTRDAVSSSTILIRGGLSNPTARRINLTMALKGKDFVKNNVVLQAQDVVFVPKKFIADLNYVLNMVLDPLSKGAYFKEQYHDNW